MRDLQKFERYLAHLGEAPGHADRQAGLRGYCTSLMVPLKRKSVEALAAHLAPSATCVGERDVGVRSGQPAGSLIVVSAPGMGRGAGTSREGWRSDLASATKPAIALAQIERLIKQGALGHCVLSDGGYGVETAFQERLSELGLPYMLGVTGQVTVWPPGHAPLPPEPYSSRGNAPTRQRLGDAKHQRPLSVNELAFELDPSKWHTLEWSAGTNFTLRSRFTRARAAHRNHQRSQWRPQERLLIKCPEGHRKPMKYPLYPLLAKTCTAAHRVGDQHVQAHRARPEGPQTGN